MNKKILLGIVAIILAIAFVAAVAYPEPFNSNVDAGLYNLSNANWVSAFTINGTNIVAGDITVSGNMSGEVNWTYLWNYPAACPGSSSITQLGDSVTCSDLWFNLDGNETIGGNMTFTNNTGILNLSFLEMRGTNISNISYLNPGKEELFVGGNMTLGNKITFGFGQIIDNIIDGWLTLTGKIQVNGNTNMTGDLNVSSNLYVAGNITGNQIYGEMWIHNDSSYKLLVIGSQNVWYNISMNSTHADSGQKLNGFTFDEASNALQADVAGLYRVDYSLSTGNAGTNQEYEFTITLNDVLQNNTDTHRKISAAGDVGNVGGTGFLIIDVGDNVNLQTVNRDGTSDLQLHAVNINLIRMGD